MVRILATADWQLGKAFSTIGAAADPFREQLFRTAEHIITTTAVEQEADVVLILGDTFDRRAADWALIERVATLFRDSEKPIHIIPGNHDPWQSGGLLEALSRELEDAEHVVFHSEQSPFRLDEFDMTLYPGVLKQRTDLGDRDSWIPDREDSDGLRVGMFHGSIESFGGDDSRQRSIDPDVAENRDLDLALLGDWHGGEMLDHPERSLWYAGAPEPQRISHNWQGRVLMIEAGLKGEPTVEPIIVGKLKFVDFEFVFDLDMGNPTQLLADQLEGIEGEPESTYIRVKLAGEVTPEIIEGIDVPVDSFSTNWSFIHSDLTGLQTVFPEDEERVDDPLLRQLEDELAGMGLPIEVFSRSVVLLRRSYRRLG